MRPSDRAPTAARRASLRNRILGASCLAAILAPLPAAAQTSGPALEEIVVTARKQEENLQRVPISITAVSGAELQQKSIQSLSDLANNTPNLTYASLGAGRAATPTIRGVAPLSIGSEPNVAVFVNGVYRPSTAALEFDGLDLERIEVARGPQSALYGQNAFSGAINYVTKRPTNQLEASAQVSAGTDKYFDGYVSIRGPIIQDKLLAGLSFGGNSFDGTFKNAGDPSNNLQGYNNQTVSIDLLIKPIDRLQIDVFASYRDFFSDSRANSLLANNCGRNAAGVAIQYCGALPYPKSADISAGAIGNVGQTFDGSVVINYDFNEHFTLTSQTAYSDAKLQNNWDDLDLSTAGAPYRITDSVTGLSRTVNTQFWIAQSNGRTKAKSQELRLSFKSDRLNAMIGGYYFDSDRDNKTAVAIDSSSFGPNERGAFAVFETKRPFADPRPGSLSFNQREQSAVFGQIGAEVLPGLRATAEGRYTRDEVMQDGIPATVAAHRQKTFKYSTPRFTLDYTPRDNVLIYASAARGQRAGGFNASPGLPSEVSYNGDSNWTYELGAKTSLFNRRLTLDGAIFNVRWTDVLINSASQNTASIFPVIRNSGKVDVKGFEIQANLAVTDDLRLSAGYGYADPKFGNGTIDLGLISECGIPAGGICRFNAAGLPDISGNQLPRTAKHTANFTANYERPVTAEWKVYARGDLSYRSKAFSNSGNNQHAPSYAILNARIGVSSERLDLSLWAKNLLDKEYIQGAQVFTNRLFISTPTTTVIAGDGRVVGVTAKVRYGAAPPRAAAPAAGSSPPPPPPPPPPPAPVAYEAREFVVYFPFDQYVLTPEAQQVISQAADYAKGGNATRVVVVGHADTSGSAAYNVRLSERRAKATADALVGSGLAQTALAVDWKGETMPAVATADGVKGALNRRATININF